MDSAISNNYNDNIFGVFYTHNRVDNSILDMVINYLNKIIEDKNILIVASSYLPLKNFKGINLISKIKNSGHLSIAIQIIQALIHAKRFCKFENVCFLEHDILYPIDYFDNIKIENNVLCNTDYIQISNLGFEMSKGGKPLSQLVMKYDFALNHFVHKVPLIFDGDIKLEPRNEIYQIRHTTPSLHFRHANYTTSHFNTFDKKYYDVDKTWGSIESIKSKIGDVLRP